MFRVTHRKNYLQRVIIPVAAQEPEKKKEPAQDTTEETKSKDPKSSAFQESNGKATSTKFRWSVPLPRFRVNLSIAETVCGFVPILALWSCTPHSCLHLVCGLLLVCATFISHVAPHASKLGSLALLVWASASSLTYFRPGCILYTIKHTLTLLGSINVDVGLIGDSVSLLYIVFAFAWLSVRATPIKSTVPVPRSTVKTRSRRQQRLSFRAFLSSRTAQLTGIHGPLKDTSAAIFYASCDMYPGVTNSQLWRQFKLETKRPVPRNAQQKQSDFKQFLAGRRLELLLAHGPCEDSNPVWFFSTSDWTNGYTNKQLWAWFMSSPFLPSRTFPHRSQWWWMPSYLQQLPKYLTLFTRSLLL